MRLDGLSTIITGANSGIGRALVERFLHEGARVVAVARPGHDLSPSEGLAIVEGDVRAYETSARAVEAAQEKFGGLDCFIANAGVWDWYKRIESLTPQELDAAFDEIFSVNVKAAIYAAHAAGAALRAAGGALIVTASVASFRGGGGGALYTASKFALRGLVMQLAMEFAPQARVNAVAPGATDTPIKGPAALGQSDKRMNENSALGARQAQRTPLGFVAAPEDHAALYVMLASKTEARAVTGAVFLSDGGLLAGI
jgi:2,3-dihydroxy-2,3-dihydrophenylpropionate dehydrogenase